MSDRPLFASRIADLEAENAGLARDLAAEKESNINNVMVYQHEISALTLVIEKMREALAHDQAGLVSALQSCIKECDSRRWIVEGRGNAEWDDDGYRKETGYALDTIRLICAKALAGGGRENYRALLSLTPASVQKEMKAFHLLEERARTCGWNPDLADPLAALDEARKGKACPK